MHPEPQNPPQPEPGDVLSLAEAAAWVGVGHLDLRAGLDAAEVQLIAGMRGGRALRLVRVCDLRTVFPSVATKPAPGAEWFTEVCPEDEVPGALFAGLSRLRPSAGGMPARSTKPAEPESVREDPQRDAGVASGETTRYLRRQLDRTRAEVAVTKDENSRLKQELLSSADAVKKWLDCVRDDAPRTGPPVRASMGTPIDPPCPPAARVVRQASPTVRKGGAEKASWHHRLSLIVGGLLVVVGLVGGSGIVGGLGWGGRKVVSEGQPTPVREASGRAPRSTLVQNEAPAAEPETVIADQGSAVGREPSIDPSWVGPSDRDLFELFNAEKSDSEPEVAATEAVEVEAPEAPEAPEAIVPAPPMVVAPGSAIFEASMAQSGEQGVGECCLYFAVTRPGMEGRDLIGPCQGVWSPRLGAVVASHHRHEHSICRGHDHFDRTMRGSMARAREMTRVAKAEGLLSPLLSLRVERSAASMLREEIPVWIQSGFESGVLGVGHHVEPTGKADRWSVDSWVRYLDFAGVEIQRRFRLSLALGDGPRGDVLLSLQWEED